MWVLRARSAGDVALIISRVMALANVLAITLALVALALPRTAFAQRADDNVTAESDDAFGRSVGNESVGIYNSDDVRGFSPIDAGNVRIEGLYFGRQTDPTQRLIEGSAIRVGIAAQSYPFPSPTGIVDYDLRRAGDKRVISTVVSYGPFGSKGAEVDAQFPIAQDTFGVAAGLGFYRDRFQWGGDSPFLANATATVHASERLAVYGSYTEGLEESPIAPDNATNRNGAAPALNTDQYDAGIRWAMTGSLKLIAGVFHIDKPYFDVDPNGLFRALGTAEHRGVELSLAGKPARSLTVVAGTRFLDAEVSGATVDAGLIGSKPVGTAKRYSIASIDYAIGGTRVSLDAVVENISRQVANTANTLEVPGRTVLHVGGRYRFKLFGKPATARAQVSNVFDRYGWSVSSGGVYAYNAPRRFTANIAADL